MLHIAALPCSRPETGTEDDCARARRLAGPYNGGMFREARAMMGLAWPLIVAEMGWVVMGIVDTIAVGPLGPAAIGAVSTGSTLFFSFMVFGIGTFYALDTFVAQNYGAGRTDECHRWLVAGLQLAVVLSILLMV